LRGLLLREEKDGERGRGGRGKGRGEEKGRDPNGWLTPPCSKSWKISCDKLSSDIPHPCFKVDYCIIYCYRFTRAETIFH